MYVIIIISAVLIFWAFIASKKKPPRPVVDYPPPLVHIPVSHITDQKDELYSGTFNIAGPQHYLVGGLPRISEYEQVYLLVDYGNRYDRNAVRIENEYGEKIGYVPRDEAPVIKQYIEQGYIIRSHASIMSMSDFIDIEVDYEVYEQ